VVGNKIVADLVALIDDGPQRAGLRLEVHAVGIAQAESEDAAAAGRGIDLPDRGTPLLFGHAVLGDIAVGADGGIEVRAVARSNDVFGPVMIVRTAWKA